MLFRSFGPPLSRLLFWQKYWQIFENLHNVNNSPLQRVGPISALNVAHNDPLHQTHFFNTIRLNRVISFMIVMNYAAQPRHKDCIRNFLNKNQLRGEDPSVRWIFPSWSILALIPIRLPPVARNRSSKEGSFNADSSTLRFLFFFGLDNLERAELKLFCHHSSETSTSATFSCWIPSPSPGSRFTTLICLLTPSPFFPSPEKVIRARSGFGSGTLAFFPSHLLHLFQGEGGDLTSSALVEWIG